MVRFSILKVCKKSIVVNVNKSLREHDALALAIHIRQVRPVLT